MGQEVGRRNHEKNLRICGGMCSCCDDERGCVGILNEALELATKSAEQGDAFGMYVLSRIYKNKRYPVYDESKSAEWEKKARKAAKNDPTIEFHDQ